MAQLLIAVVGISCQVWPWDLIGDLQKLEQYLRANQNMPVSAN